MTTKNDTTLCHNLPCGKLWLVKECLWAMWKHTFINYNLPRSELWHKVVSFSIALTFSEGPILVIRKGLWNACQGLGPSQTQLESTFTSDYATTHNLPSYQPKTEGCYHTLEPILLPSRKYLPLLYSFPHLESVCHD